MDAVILLDIVVDLLQNVRDIGVRHPTRGEFCTAKTMGVSVEVAKVPFRGWMCISTIPEVV